MHLLSVQSQGFLWCLLIAIICAVIVHGVKLAVIGYKSLGKTPPEPPPQKQPEKQPEPVYFLVERKKKKPKSEYSEPKQINFQ